jgi:phage portal protein BeeE
LPRGQRARFNLEALLRSDTTTRYAAHKVALEVGFLTVAEVRAIENLPPLTNLEGAST